MGTETILQWLAVRPGDPFDPRRVARALKDLTRKGRFSDVHVDGEIEGEGIVLYVVVEEYPQLKSVRLEGVDNLKESDLRAETTLGARSFLTPWELREDITKITRLYRDKGYHRASVSDTLMLTEVGEFDLVLRVTEGQKASVQQITFVGNDNIPTKHLQKQMETSADGFWGGGELKSDVLQQDFQKIADFYQTRGYLDAEVTKHELDLADNGRDLTLRIHVFEGKQYLVGDVTWTGNTVFPDEQVRQNLQLFKGLPFDQSMFEASTQALYELYQDKGYFYFVVSPNRDVRDETVNVVFVLQEGQQARLNHVRIVGNTKTQDKVVLREFVLLPGDTFDRSRLTRSLREVFQLGFFDDVNIPPEGIRPRDDGSVDVDLAVVERQTGQLGAGAGYSAVNALTGFFEMAETNLFGTGKRLSLRWEFSKRRNDINFSYTQPWFMDTPTTVTIDLFNSTGRTNVNSFYRLRRIGAALSVGRRLNALDFTTLFWRTRAERVTYQDFALDIPDSLRLQLSAGNRRISTGMTLKRNSTDNPFFPGRGSDAEFSTNLVGTFLGGDEHYIRNEVQLAWFQRIGFSKVTFMLKSRFGHLRVCRGTPYRTTSCSAWVVYSSTACAATKNSKSSHRAIRSFRAVRQCRSSYRSCAIRSVRGCTAASFSTPGTPGTPSARPISRTSRRARASGSAWKSRCWGSWDWTTRTASIVSMPSVSQTIAGNSISDSATSSDRDDSRASRRSGTVGYAAIKRS